MKILAPTTIIAPIVLIILTIWISFAHTAKTERPAEQPVVYAQSDLDFERWKAEHGDVIQPPEITVTPDQRPGPFAMAQEERSLHGQWRDCTAAALESGINNVRSLCEQSWDRWQAYRKSIGLEPIARE
jgi:hypothetical protein